MRKNKEKENKSQKGCDCYSRWFFIFYWLIRRRTRMED